MNRRDWIQLQFYTVKCLTIVGIVLAIVAIVHGGVNTFQLFNNNNPINQNK
jgi:hypothetical protein